MRSKVAVDPHRAPKIALPTRTLVAPAPTATTSPLSAWALMAAMASRRLTPLPVFVSSRALVTVIVALAALGSAVFVAIRHQRAEEGQETQNQLFVDTASQFVVNMFSYTQQSIDEDVDRFVNNTSGPLRDMMSQGQNTENLKLLFRDTNASAEAVINGAALEKLDKVADRADVLVAVRVTVTDLDGNNAPSKPYRLRVTVAEDDNGHMSFYDLKYPDGGN